MLDVMLDIRWTGRAASTGELMSRHFGFDRADQIHKSELRRLRNEPSDLCGDRAEGHGWFVCLTAVLVLAGMAFGWLLSSHLFFS